MAGPRPLTSTPVSRRHRNICGLLSRRLNAKSIAAPVPTSMRASRPHKRTSRRPYRAGAVSAASRESRGVDRPGRILIGTSGWHYTSWRGPFFPEQLRQQDHLRFYAQQFCTTELNGVFYRTPSLETVEAWRQQTPAGFVFAWKASKYITHWKRLGVHSQNSIELLETRLQALRAKAGPVLFQLPPTMQSDRDRLASFLKLLSRKWRYAFEFRHPSWYEAEIFEVLREHDVALCLSDHHAAPAPWLATASHVYIRGHGPGGRYRGHYPAATLKQWAARINGFASQGHAVYCYFDNDQKSAAPLDAQRLCECVNRLFDCDHQQKP
jgi:uncharacterized protein YecE (DUF72 family)